PGVARGLLLDGPPPLAATAPGGKHGGAEITDLPMANFREIATRDGLDAFRRAWSAHPLTQLVTRDATSHALLARILARYPGRDLLEPGAAPQECVDAAVLARIHTPALVVNGARDTAARREAGLGLARSLARAEHVFIPDA